MIVWRISNHEDLLGNGGLYAPGRWHSKGKLIVYCAPNPATALLEYMVHNELPTEQMPVGLKFLKVLIPDAASRNHIEQQNLPPDWRNDISKTRDIGDKWLGLGNSWLLFVPSVLVPDTQNIVLNPRHTEHAGARVDQVIRYSLDGRLLNPTRG